MTNKEQQELINYALKTKEARSKGGKKAAEVRFKGKTKEEISKEMSRIVSAGWDKRKKGKTEKEISEQMARVAKLGWETRRKNKK